MPAPKEDQLALQILESARKHNSFRCVPFGIYEYLNKSRATGAGSPEGAGKAMSHHAVVVLTDVSWCSGLARRSKWPSAEQTLWYQHLESTPICRGCGRPTTQGIRPLLTQQPTIHLRQTPTCGSWSRVTSRRERWGCCEHQGSPPARLSTETTTTKDQIERMCCEGAASLPRRAHLMATASAQVIKRGHRELGEGGFVPAAGLTALVPSPLLLTAAPW